MGHLSEICFVCSPVVNCFILICVSLAGWLQGQDVAFEPAKLVWLIQRDFLRKLTDVLCHELLELGLRAVLFHSIKLCIPVKHCLTPAKKIIFFLFLWLQILNNLLIAIPTRLFFLFLLFLPLKFPANCCKIGDNFWIQKYTWLSSSLDVFFMLHFA